MPLYPKRKERAALKLVLHIQLPLVTSLRPLGQVPLVISLRPLAQVPLVTSLRPLAQVRLVTSLRPLAQVPLLKYWRPLAQVTELVTFIMPHLLGAMDSTPCSSGAVTKPSYHGHNIVEADPSPTTCTTCEYNKKKRKALLKKQNRLKKKYEGLQWSYNRLRVSTF